jgi:hypothetical protein
VDYLEQAYYGQSRIGTSPFYEAGFEDFEKSTVSTDEGAVILPTGTFLYPDGKKTRPCPSRSYVGHEF